MNPFRNSKSQQYGTEVELGKKYRDRQTGVEGIATSVTFFQHACERVCLEYIGKDGDLKELIFDAPRLETVAPIPKPVTSAKTGGTRNTPGQRGTNAR